VKIVGSFRRSLILLSRHLENSALERLFFNLRFEMVSSEFFIHPFYSSDQTESNATDISCNLCSISTEDLSLLDIETLRGILSSESLRIESEDWLLKQLLKLGHDYSMLFEFVRFEFLSNESISLFVDHFEYYELSETIWHGIVRRLKKDEDRTMKSLRFCDSMQSVSNSISRLDSIIISSIPSIFNEFGSKTYRLLYRGSRDGFDSVHFHAKVDGHSNTVTIIETTKGFIFGGYMKCGWDSSNSWKTDDSQTSFLFTSKIPHIGYPSHPLASHVGVGAEAFAHTRRKTRPF
jgi:hypothetical protein